MNDKEWHELLLKLNFILLETSCLIYGNGNLTGRILRVNKKTFTRANKFDDNGEINKEYKNGIDIFAPFISNENNKKIKYPEVILKTGKELIEYLKSVTPT